MGFEEVSHTADWSARIWAQDLASLFAEAARAMNSLSGTLTGTGPRLKRPFETESPDVESLLVAFLSELVYCQEQENVAFDGFEIKVASQRLTVEMEGAEIVSVDKAIKAVTYHQLSVTCEQGRWHARVIFDV